MHGRRVPRGRGRAADRAGERGNRVQVAAVLPTDTTLEEDTKPTIIAHHDVDDTERWLASPKRAEFFGTLGITNIRTFVDPVNPSQVALMLDVPDLDALTAALQSEEAAAAMQHDGVHPDTVVLLVESGAT